MAADAIGPLVDRYVMTPAEEPSRREAGDPSPNDCNFEAGIGVHRGAGPLILGRRFSRRYAKRAPMAGKRPLMLLGSPWGEFRPGDPKYGPRRFSGYAAGRSNSHPAHCAPGSATAATGGMAGPCVEACIADAP